MSPPLMPVVRVLAAGAALSVAASACSGKDTRTENPPRPEPPPGNPPPPEADSNLPEWDDIESDHPKGATNPPIPVLVTTEDGRRCWKHWRSSMLADRDLIELGGWVVTSPEEAQGVEIQCPAKERDALLAKHAKRQAQGDPAPDAD